MERGCAHHHHHHHPVKKENCWRAVGAVSQIATIIFCGILIFHSYQIKQIKSALKKKADVKLSTFTALSLIGNEQVVRGVRYLPIRGWKIEYQYGNISFLHGRKIQIKVAGFYYVHLQMFFYQNGNRYKTVNKEKYVMDIGIVNRGLNKRLLAATISLTSCMNVCTKHVSRIIYLKKESILTVHTATPGVYFRMIKEKTHFGVFLLQQI